MKFVFIPWINWDSYLHSRPHQLVRDRRKIELRKNFFSRFFKQTNLYLVNTIEAPEDVQHKIRELVAGSRVS